MVILHLLAPAQVGGLERVVHSLAIAQQARGHQVTVAAVLEGSDDAESFFEPLERAKVPVRRIVASQRAYFRERKEVRALLREISPDVVHSHGYRPDVIDAGMIRRSGVATVTTAHGYTGGSWRNRLYEGIQRLAFRRFDSVIAVSDALGALLRRSGVPKERLHIVPNAFVQVAEPLTRSEARAELQVSNDDFVVGWVGRMIREKGLDVMVDAVGQLRGLPVVVCAIGDGPDRQPQQIRAAQGQLSDHIRWPGMLKEASRYFPAFDVFVISSRTEGLPISLLEAMASRVPIVTTRVGGIPQAVTSEHALLVDPGQPESLATAIREVQVDRASARRRAERAYERLTSRFSTDAWLARHEQVYTEAINIRSRSVGART